MNKIVFDSPIGNIAVFAENEKIIRLDLKTKEEADSAITEKVLINAKKQLLEYFSGERENFDLELEFFGTEFQKSVWKELLNIPFGETRTYGEIADAIGRQKAVRAVGSACGKNPVAIIVPCHRVLKTNGKTGGFAFGTETKEKLLFHEEKLKGERNEN